MQDPKNLILISKHFSGNETSDEKQELIDWLNLSKDNVALFEEVKKTWQFKKEESLPFYKKITKEKVTDILVQHGLGNLVGFAVGLWVTNSFTHYVVEKRNIKNLFGIAGRKKVIVNETPEWVQYCLSFILGFIALELINYFFQTKKHELVWNFIVKKIKNK